jgi:tetratricopeptide (TPR) repeat protein
MQLFTHSQLISLPELAGDLSSEFEITRVLSGGMGICAKAVHIESGEAIALKGVRPDRAWSDTAWQRFRAEALTWVDLSRVPGVVPAYGVTRWNGTPLVAARWMAGGDLRHRMRNRDPESYFRTALRLAGTMELVSGRYGIVHRDLKPENVLFEGDHAYVTDWGIARGLGQALVGSREQTDAEPRLTQPGAFLGTILYAAPEQIIDAGAADWRADMYALGCILHEWETGRPVFEGPDIQDVARQHLQEPPAPLGSSVSRGAFGTAHVVATCLEKNPDRRYPSFAALIDELDAAAARFGLSVSRMEPPPFPQAPIVSRDRRVAVLDEDTWGPELARAQALIGLRKYHDAHAILAKYYVEDLLDEDSGWTFAHACALSYAICLSGMGPDQDAALSVYSRLEEAAGKPAEYYVNCSLTLLRAQAFEQAELKAREGRSVYPRDAELLGNLMSALSEQGKLTEALALAESRLQSARDVGALFDVAVVEYRAARQCFEDWPAATQHLKQALSLLTEAHGLNPTEPGVLYTRAQVHRDLFMFAEASADAQAAYDAPEGPSYRQWALALTAELLFLTRSPEQAVAFVNEWLPRINDQAAMRAATRVKARVLVDRTIGLEQDGTRLVPREALEFYQAQVRQGSATADDHVELARIYEWLGERGSALELIQRCLEQWPGHWRALVNRSQFQLRVGEHRAALAAAETAIETAPYRPEPLDALAAVYEAWGDKGRAEEARARADRVHRQRMALARPDTIPARDMGES